MTPSTRYNYENRIKVLATENARLKQYEAVVREIFDGIVSSNDDSSGLRIRWLLGKIRMVLK